MIPQRNANTTGYTHNQTLSGIILLLPPLQDGLGRLHHHFHHCRRLRLVSATEKSAIPRRFGLWDGVLLWRVGCGYMHGKDRAVGVERE